MVNRIYQRPTFSLLPNNKDHDKEQINCIPDLVLFNAIKNPHHVFCLQSSESSDSFPSQLDFTSITYSQLAQAVDNCCEWILSNAPGAFEARVASNGSVSKSVPVALFMESDIGLFIYLVALLTLNVPCLLLSIRLSPNALRHLVNETTTASVIASSRMLSGARNAIAGSEAAESSSIILLEAIPFARFSSTKPSSHQPLQRTNKTPSANRENDRDVLILHSSGTTGLPKAIHLSHRYLLGYATCHSFPPNEDEYSRGINLSTLPLYHGFGALAPCLALSVGKTVCFPPTSAIPTASLVSRLLKQRKMASLMTVPTIMEEMVHIKDFPANSAEIVDLDFVAVGGGGLKPAVADVLHKNGVKLLNHFGATELGALAPIFRPTADYDHRYLRLRTDLNLRLIFSDNDPNSSSNEARPCKLVGYPFAWSSEFELQDALENNPRKPTSEVRILGRNDDLVVLATGEKVMPNAFEQIIENHPLIETAVVVGQGQFEIGLLIEPLSEYIDDGEFVDKIWPYVDSANERMDRHARISTQAAIIVKPQTKEIPRTDKGSVRRRELYQVFEDDIQSMYGRLDTHIDSGRVSQLDFADLRPSIKKLVQTCLPRDVQQTEFGIDDDLITLDMDSLASTRLRRLLQASLRYSQQNGLSLIELPSDFVYSNPSIARLATALTNPYASQENASRKQQEMRKMVKKYAKCRVSGIARKDDVVVLLTGATGNLGAHILPILSEITTVKRVISLVRVLSSSHAPASEESLRTRQEDACKKMGIPITKINWSKIDLIGYDAAAASFGISESKYEYLTMNVTHIFHSAWSMDFKRTLFSFESQIKAASNIVQLGRDIHCARTHCRPRVIMASSIAVVGRHSSTVVPEEIASEASIPLPIGYAEAKWVCEKIFEDAFTELKDEIEPMIARIGQISGSQHTGFWTTHEHLASMVKASQSLGAMPDLDGTLSWLPVNRAASVISELMLSSLHSLHSQPPQLVFHVENSIRQPWSDTLTIIERKLGISSSKRLQFDEWVTKAREEEAINPNLLDFMERYFLHMSGGGVILNTKNTREMSRTLRSFGSVDKETIDLYVDYWRSINFLS